MVENQSLLGHFDGRGAMHFRFCPKDAKTYRYTIRSNAPALDGRTGEITSFPPAPEAGGGDGTAPGQLSRTRPRSGPHRYF